MTACGPSGTELRPAQPADAEAMAALFREIYPSPPGLPAGHGYPFPQYMDECWLAGSIEEGAFAWLAALRGSEFVGCFGAAVDVGTPESGDRVAELTGLIVAEPWRLRGIGQALLNEMCSFLDDRAAVVLSETRTGNLGGCRGSRNAGFFTIGFEPCAHKVLGRHEPMIMMCRVSDAAARDRRLDYQPSRHIRPLGSVCLEPLGLGAPSASARSAPLPKEDVPLQVVAVGPATYARSAASWKGRSWHASGVVGHRRIEGLNYDEQRYVDRHFEVRSGGIVRGFARLNVDLVDQRARVLRLQTDLADAQGPFLDGILDLLGADPHLQELTSLVLDLRADFPRFQTDLAELGFFPTIYYPGFIATSSGRVDGVQFTRLLRPRVCGDGATPTEVDPHTATVVEAVRAAMRRRLRADGG